MKHAVKRLVASLNPAAPGSGCRVLLYHAVGPRQATDRVALCVEHQAFQAQMEWLRAQGYRVVPLTALLDRSSDQDGRTVAITFDDGYRSQLVAADVLERLAWPATFFVVPRFLDGGLTDGPYWERWDHLTWAELRELASRGFEIGAHSASHAVLTKCAPGVLWEEVRTGKSRLEDHLGREVVSFSYPHGAFNRAVEGVVEQAGYHLACTSIYGANGAPSSRFRLHRIEITGRDRLTDFRLKLLGKYDWLASWQRWQASHA